MVLIITEGLIFPGGWGAGALQDLRGEERCEAPRTGAQQSNPLLTAMIIIGAHHYFQSKCFVFDTVREVIIIDIYLGKQ